MAHMLVEYHNVVLVVDAPGQDWLEREDVASAQRMAS